MFRKLSLLANLEKLLERRLYGSVRDVYEGQCIERVTNARIIQEDLTRSTRSSGTRQTGNRKRC